MKWFRNLLKGVSLTGALFVFQACYGMYQVSLLDESGIAPMSFSLVSGNDGNPIEGIRILGKSDAMGTYEELGMTGEDGRCEVQIPYRRNKEGPFLRFEDTGGNFLTKDTSFVDLRPRDIVIKLVDTRQ